MTMVNPGPASSSMDLGKFDHDLTVLPNTGNHGYWIREIIPFYGPTIQVSELL